MIDKLDKIKERFEFLNDELSKAEVCSDAEKYGKYSKERAELEETAETYGKYLAAEK